MDFIPQHDRCPLCQADQLRTFQAYASDMSGAVRVNIVECRRCVFAWQYPLGRNEQQSVEFFETVYADEEQAPSEYFTSEYKRKIAQLEYEFVAGLPEKGKTLLDIGAGPGIFAEVAAEHGRTVTAVDPALDVERLQKKPSITAIKGTVDSIQPEQLFDVVTMWDVIEHTTDPVAQILKAKQRLREGGWLVLETGNYKSAFRVHKGPRHWMYQVEHRWYFSPESLKKLLQKTGFSECIFSDRMLRPGWTGSADYKGPSARRTVKSILKDPFHLPQHLSRYISLLNVKNWDRAGIEIFAIAARAPKVEA
ncbi:MAG: class I SAM-dependent methyltransferase [Candidatus Electrothrix aestuarii]|uniref:Class I SAM-dependent methyltransferase n=1 Tax=Candidatus Electrothrix aestuarii TaxID=3062594 RepID=A0AAU8LY40_9BACT|nr:class I SAM-dependent methyltransferase [Candidatus Electrothrix aestuarii]